MSDISSNLNLPYLMPSQSQKHVTVNETIRSLDLIIHLSILDRDLTAPPTAPNDGERFLVAAGGSGAWSGEDGKIAGWVDGAWQFLSAKVGWTVWVADEAAYLVFDGLIWTEITGTGAGGNAFSQLGVGGATPDVTNRLAVASDAVLFNHAGSNAQAKINKNAVGDTASLLFQTGFSGRAEFGTTGDDNWHVKVSPDGAIWNEALVIDRTSGDVGVGISSPLAKLDIDGPIKIKSYTLATLPPSVVGGIIYVADAVGGPSLAVGDGTSWLPLGGGGVTNQAPVISDAVFAIDENLPAGTVVGVVTASDPDSGDVLSFAITAGDPGGLFVIDGVGQITTTASLDFEATSQHLLIVQATDDGSPPLSDTASITVDVNNVDDTAPILSAASGSANVLTIAGQVSTDEGNGILYWALVTGTTAPSATAIIAGTGFVDSGNQVISTAGIQNINAIALAVSTDHSLHFVQIDSVLNQSGVASSASITTGSALGTPNFTSVNADGWSATYPSPPTFDPYASPETFGVTRSGFNATGAAITFDEGLTNMVRIRQAYPSHASLTADQVALDQFIYSGDTVAGAVNNSTLTYPKPQAMWLNHDLEHETTSTFTAKLAVAHRHARSGRPVAAVKFTASDGTTTVETIVSAMTLETYTGSGFSAPHYAGNLDLSTLTPGLITIDAVIYPWVGTAFTISADADIYPSPNLTVLKVLNDRDGSYGTVYAYVDGVGGGSPAVHETAATAVTTPYATVAAAAAAVKVYNNANFSRNNTSGGIIRLTATTHTHSSFQVSNVGEIPLVIEAANPANKATTIYQDAGASTSNSLPLYTKFKDITIKRNASGSVIFLDASASNGTSHMLVTENVTWDDSTFGASWGAYIYKVGRFYNINSDGDEVGQAILFSSVFKTVISIGSGNGSMQPATYHAVGCKHADGVMGVSGPAANRPGSKGTFIGWCFMGQNTNATKVIDVGIDFDPDRGMAIVGSIFEHYGGTSGPVFLFNADGNTDITGNVNLYCNTCVGSRSNIAYQDTGPAEVSKVVASRFCVHEARNTKGDVFGTNGLLIGNWPVIFQVGCQGNATVTGDSNGASPGTGNWIGEIKALNDVNGTPGSPLDPLWTDDQSFGAGGAGGGDYTPGAATPLPDISAGLAPHSHDMLGRAIADDGSAVIGALQKL